MPDVFTVEHLKLLGPWFFVGVFAIREGLHYIRNRAESRDKQTDTTLRLDYKRDLARDGLLGKMIEQAHMDNDRMFKAIQSLVAELTLREQRINTIDQKVDSVIEKLLAWQNKLNSIEATIEKLKSLKLQ